MDGGGSWGKQLTAGTRRAKSRVPVICFPLSSFLSWLSSSTSFFCSLQPPLTRQLIVKASLRCLAEAQVAQTQNRSVVRIQRSFIVHSYLLPKSKLKTADGEVMNIE